MNIECFKGDNFTVVGANSTIDLDEPDEAKVEEIENTRSSGSLRYSLDDNDFDK